MKQNQIKDDDEWRVRCASVLCQLSNNLISKENIEKHSLSKVDVKLYFDVDQMVTACMKFY